MRESLEWCQSLSRATETAVMYFVLCRATSASEYVVTALNWVYALRARPPVSTRSEPGLGELRAGARGVHRKRGLVARAMAGALAFRFVRGPGAQGQPKPKSTGPHLTRKGK